MPTLRKEFTSFADYIRQAETGLPSTSQSRSSRTSYNDDWAGGSWSDSLADAKQGWRSGAERIAKLAQPLLNQVTSHMTRPEIVMDIEGDSIDIGTFLTGNPEPFLRWQETEINAQTSGKFVHILLNAAISGGYTPEKLFSRGAAVAALIDALEMSGRRVILDIGMATQRDSYQFEQLIRVKNSGDALNMEIVAMACAHPGMLRRLGFSVMEQAPIEYVEEIGYSDGMGYGRPCDFKADSDIYIGANVYGLVENPLAWAKEQLLKQGVEFSD